MYLFVLHVRVLVDYTHVCRVAQAKEGLSCCPKSRGHYTTCVWTDGKANTFTFDKLHDVSALAGTSQFKEYVKTLQVPEPTTATLSLLALAGLCARRRRRV